MRVVCPVPDDDGLKGLAQFPVRLPTQRGACFGAVELEVMGFVRMGAAVQVPACAVAPVLSELLDDPLYGLGVFFSGTKVKGLRKGWALGVEIFSKCKVATQGLQYMLPGARGVGVADVDALAGFDGAQDVWNKPVLGPISATDNVACPSCCQGDLMFTVFRCIEERVAIGCRDQFGAAFAAAVRVEAAHGFVLTVTPHPFFVLVALVGGDVDDGTHGGRLAHGFQKIYGAHDIGGIGLDRVDIGAAHQRLRGHVNNDIGRGLSHGIGQPGAIADVADDGCHALRHLRHFKQAGVGGWRQHIAGDLGTELL